MVYLYSRDPLLMQHWRDALNDFPLQRVDSPSACDAPEASVLLASEEMFGAHPELLRSWNRPGLGILVLSRIPVFETAERCLASGASGYGNAMMHPDHLHSAVRAILDGAVWLHPDFIARLISQVKNETRAPSYSRHLEHLSAREREVALLLADGASHQAIADALAITVRTVKAHCTAIYDKLGVKDRLALSILFHS